MMKAVRGAIRVGSNDRASIESAGARIARAVLEANDLVAPDLVSLLYSVTRDLTAGNPATGAREGVAGLSEVPLFCVQEADVQGSPALTVRLLATFEVPDRWAASRRARPTPVYLDGAEVLRPDLRDPSAGSERDRR